MHHHEVLLTGKWLIKSLTAGAVMEAYHFECLKVYTVRTWHQFHVSMMPQGKQKCL
jgi:hypothetical protein